MKIIRKRPEHVGYVYTGEEMIPEYRCPNKKCGFGVAEDWICCPYCGQKLGTFCENEDTKCLTICFGLRKERMRQK